MRIQFLGATGTVTGSCYLIQFGKRSILMECGQIQGARSVEALNYEEMPFSLTEIDAVILSHAHIDHSGRVPLLHKWGYDGPIVTHHATRALCNTMLRDSAYLHEKDAEWTNRRRRRKGLAPVEPLYTQEDAEAVMGQFRGAEYGDIVDVVPGLKTRFSDAGHILGAAIVELWLQDGSRTFKLVFSGDLGYIDAPVMEDPTCIDEADHVLLESTYGDRDHRSFEATMNELKEIFRSARGRGGNILIPAFAVGRTQDLLYLMNEHYAEWDLDGWHVYLDSPMALEATDIYSRYRHLYGARLFRKMGPLPMLPNFQTSRSSADSMRLNQIEAGAIIIAGSGMCTGGRIMHHLKHNLWRDECDVIFVGYQAAGSLGRKIIDGARYVRLFQEAIRVNARVHTVGGLSAHADQSGLLDWYSHFSDTPPVSLVHGEDDARGALAKKLAQRFGIEAHMPDYGDELQLA